jgi:Cd2+/Zn2+-exporting ATPase
MNSPDQLQETTFRVDGLCCATEEQLIRKKLGSKREVAGLDFNVISHTLRVRHSSETGTIIEWLRDAGFQSEVIGLRKRPDQSRDFGSSRKSLQRTSTLLSGAFLALGGMFSWAAAPEVIANGCFILSILSGGWNIAWKAVKAVTNFSLDMNFLMALAANGAVAIGEHAEGAAVIFLFAVSLLLESMSLERSRKAIQTLMKLSPVSARLRRGNVEVEVPVEEVAIGERMIIRPGERVPLDGTVMQGSSTVDESTITGESFPVTKGVNDSIFAGTFNQRGALEVTTTKSHGDSTLSRIIHLVEEAQSKKAPSQSFIERFARYYTPAVFLLAIGVATIPPLFAGLPFDDWFYRALVLLVIACPCALVISTPVSIVSAVTNAARHGILIKGGKYLEQLAHVKAVALDKTGTLTQGSPRVTDIIPLNSLSADEILRVAAGIELRSEHHLAEAFLQKASEMGMNPAQIAVGDFRALTGKGVEGSIDGKHYVLGNHQLIEELGLCSPGLERILSKLESEGKTVVALTKESEVLGVIGITDPMRTESKASIDELHRLGIKNVTLLTGDNRGTAEALSKKINLHETKAELLPDDKLRVINELRQRYKTVAMVGDGVNDAPALATADIGIAMGGVGSDTSLETADVVLMNDDLSKLPYAIQLGKRTFTIIKQNIAMALVAKGVFLTLGVLGMTSLWLAILADDGATLVVILNSLRLLRSHSSVNKLDINL